MAKIFKFLAFAIVAGVAGALVTMALHIGIAPAPADGNDISYSDFLSITLTALALMITILGFFVAAAGVIGWTTIENKLRDHSVQYFKDQLDKEGPLREEFEEIISEIAYEGVENFKAQNGLEHNPKIVGDEKYND